MTTAIQQASQPQNSFQQFLSVRKSHIASVLPKHMTPDRVVKVALTTFNRTPALADCSMPSIFMAIMQAAELGLEPGGALGHAYLVPYKNQCQFILGYRGMIELARRSGEIESIEAHIVHENDEFEIEYGLNEKLVHRPCLSGDAGPLIFVYAIARLKGGGRQFEMMTKAQVDAVRNRSKAGHNGPWVTDYEEMARKTVVRRLFKYLPVSCEKIAQAMEAEQGDYIDTSVIEQANDVLGGQGTTREPTPAPPDPAQRKSSALADKIASKAATQPKAASRVQIFDQHPDGSVTMTDPETGEVVECKIGADGLPRVPQVDR